MYKKFNIKEWRRKQQALTPVLLPIIGQDACNADISDEVFCDKHLNSNKKCLWVRNIHRFGMRPNAKHYHEVLEGYTPTTGPTEKQIEKNLSQREEYKKKKALKEEKAKRELKRRENEKCISTD